MPSLCIQNLTKNHAAYISRMNELRCTGLNPRQVHFLDLSPKCVVTGTKLCKRKSVAWKVYMTVVWTNSANLTQWGKPHNALVQTNSMNLSDFNLIYNNKSAGPSKVRPTASQVWVVFYVYVSPPFWAIFIYCLAKNLGWLSSASLERSEVFLGFNGPSSTLKKARTCHGRAESKTMDPEMVSWCFMDSFMILLLRTLANVNVQLVVPK